MKCIVLVVDNSYINHAKALMVNCRKEGNWLEDFCVISSSGPIPEFSSKGIEVFEVCETGFFAKFRLFDSFFKKWDACFYMDCDCIVQSSLGVLFDQLSSAGLVMDREVYDGLNVFYAWDPLREESSHKDVYRWIEETYPVCKELCYNTSCVLWRPAHLPDNLVDKAIALQERVKLVNYEKPVGAYIGTDQQVLNLLLNNIAVPIRDKAFGFWAFDTEHHYQKDVCPVVVHYGRWYAPWIVKTPPMAAYRNERLGVVCHEFYKQNLSKFEEVFPCRS